MRLSPRLLSWASALGLVGVFTGFAAFETADRVHSSNTVQSVRRSEELRTAYQDARFEITATGGAASLFILLPSPERRALFDQHLELAKGALQKVAALGAPGDRALVATIMADDLPKLDVIKRYFAAIEAQKGFEEPLPQPSTIDDLDKVLGRAEQRQAARTAGEFDGYIGWLDTRLTIAAVMFGVTLLLLLALLLAAEIFGRRQALAQAELKHLRKAALADSLTELGNRRAFEEASAATIAAVAGGTGSLALAILDVDEFKTVNDTWGHERGDSVLRGLAKILRECCPAGATMFRIGGDEFAAILVDVDHDTVMAAMETIRLRVESELELVSVSVGVAACTGRDLDESVLRQQADAALYEAKLRGRNLAVLYHFNPAAAPVFPAAKIQAVRHLLAEGNLRAEFQPIWHLSPRTVLGYEALARLDTRYELGGPQQAFEIAEQFGRAAELDRLFRRRALEAAGGLPEGALLFVNVSPYTLTHSTFSAAGFAEEFASGGLAPSRVVLEVTERSSVAPDVVAEAMRSLRAEGFAVALDDIGSGNNGLEMLRRVPFDYIKVDRGIVSSAFDGGPGRATLMAILAFAAESGAMVLAEGVENAETLRLVQQLAQSQLSREGALIQLVQGFLLGAPAENFALRTAEDEAA